MPKPVIAVDIDDVLSHTAQAIIDYGNERWGHANTLDDFSEHLAEMWQVDAEESHQRWEEFMTSGVIEVYDVVPKAKDALEKLTQNYRLVAVTARRDSLLGITEEWLNSNYPGLMSDLIGAQIYGAGKIDAHVLTKAEVLQRISANYLIDDQPKHCIGAAEVGIPSVLYGGYPWNKQAEIPDLVTRCDTWHDVLEYFDGRD
jgi:5'(3')-deoxyribonucleotidase